MSRRGILAFACSAAIAAAACGGADRDAEQEPAVAPQAQAPAPAATGGVLGESPQEWAQKAIAGNQSEIQLGKLAAEKAQNAQVKQFAQRMVDEHSKALDELKQIASSANIPLAGDGDASEDARDLHDRLANLTGAEFDREYMEAMVDKHENTLEMLEDKAEENQNRPTGTSGPDDRTEAERDRINRELSQWAAKTAPTVRQHLERARQIHEQVQK